MVIAQDEATSKEFSMPRSAITTGDVDFILPKKIAPALMTMVGGGESRELAMRESMA